MRRIDLYDRSIEVDSIYHIYNRGVAKQPIFQDSKDYEHFLLTINFYLDEERSNKLSTAKLLKADLPQFTDPLIKPLAQSLAYVLMPNHFHFILREIEIKGISRLMRRALNSYTRYFNTRHNRVGPIFQGIFRFVLVESDEILLHLSRYIHLNPYIARLVQNLSDYPWSSLHAYNKEIVSRLCDPSFILEMAGSSEKYHSFVTDYADYAISLAYILKEHAFEEQFE